MTFNDIYMIVPSNAGLSGVIWLVLLMGIFYAARNHAHKGILSITGTLHKSLRLTARSVKLLRNILVIRNRDVLLAQGREATERMIEREFERVDATVRKDLSEYPALHRHLNENITAIDESFVESTDIPPTPPAWVKAIEVVANIPLLKGDSTVSNILTDIHKSLVKSSEQALVEFRKASAKRHKVLQKMMPNWRNVLKQLQEVDKSVNSLLTRSVVIDRLMFEYEEILKGTDKAQRMLSSSSMTQFFIAGFVLAIAVGGAFINFNLIARPMSEMVGGADMILGLKTSSIAALVIILVEISLGLFLMESLRITRLFPVIGSLDDKMRVKMVWITFIFLLSLASIEAGLAYMREILMEDDSATSAALRGDNVLLVSENSALWITTAAQMGLGFVLPFALTFVAIPLESFIHSMRTVLGVVIVALLHLFEWLLRLFGNAIKSLGKVLVHIYDFFIFIPLGVEKLINNKNANRNAGLSNDLNVGEVL